MVVLALGALSQQAWADQSPYDITFGRQATSSAAAAEYELSLVRGQDFPGQMFTVGKRAMIGALVASSGVQHVNTLFRMEEFQS